MVDSQAFGGSADDAAMSVAVKRLSALGFPVLVVRCGAPATPQVAPLAASQPAVELRATGWTAGVPISGGVALELSSADDAFLRDLSRTAPAVCMIAGHRTVSTTLSQCACAAISDLAASRTGHIPTILRPVKGLARSALVPRHLSFSHADIVPQAWKTDKYCAMAAERIANGLRPREVVEAEAAGQLAFEEAAG